MQKITPNLWFNGNAKEAVDYYLSVFPGSKQSSVAYYPNEGLADFQKDMAGKELTVDFELFNHQFTAINAGPEFTPNPSVSFIIGCETKDEINSLWEKLSSGGKARMPLDAYSFSEWYGWIQDKYGVSWQLILVKPEGEERPKVVPSLLFVKEKNGKAEEAGDFYVRVFKDSRKGSVVYFEESTEMGQKKGDVMFSEFMLEHVWFAAMDGGNTHDFDFSEGVSFLIACRDQEEIDYYWEKLTEDGGQESVCGWLKDKYGLSWQVVPANMEELMKKPNAFASMMKMRKIVIADFDDVSNS